MYWYDYKIILYRLKLDKFCIDKIVLIYIDSMIYYTTLINIYFVNIILY